VSTVTAKQADLAEQMRDIEADIRNLNSFIRDQGPQPKAAPAPRAAAAPTSAHDRLSALARLRDAGLISGEEYETKKAEILASL
jgi:hypothetical protein